MLVKLLRALNSEFKLKHTVFSITNTLNNNLSMFHKLIEQHFTVT